VLSVKYAECCIFISRLSVVIVSVVLLNVKAPTFLQIRICSFLFFQFSGAPFSGSITSFSAQSLFGSFHQLILMATHEKVKSFLGHFISLKKRKKKKKKTLEIIAEMATKLNVKIYIGDDIFVNSVNI